MRPGLVVMASDTYAVGIYQMLDSVSTCKCRKVVERCMPSESASTLINGSDIQISNRRPTFE